MSVVKPIWNGSLLCDLGW